MSNQEIVCPSCGYYCLGRGGLGCIDKPSLVAKPTLNSSQLKDELGRLKVKTLKLEKELSSMDSVCDYTYCESLATHLGLMHNYICEDCMREEIEEYGHEPEEYEEI